MDLQEIRRTAAEILAAAVYETFPDVELLGGGDTSSGFFYDFVFPHVIHPEFHIQIEEKMRQIVREKREIRDLEMVAVSAKEFLKSKGHKTRARQIEGSGLFPIVQIGNFIDLASGAHLSNTGALPAFKLFPSLLLEDKVLRIQGAAALSKDALKEFLKRWNAYSQKRHEKVGEVKHYWRFIDGDLVWLPTGLQALEELTKTFKENLIPGALEVRCPLSMDRLPLHKKILQEMRVESVLEISPIEGEFNETDDAGLLNPIEGREVQITISLNQIISSLHSITKTLTILGFSYSVHLSGSKRGARGAKLLEDGLKRIQCEYQVSPEIDKDPKIDFRVSDGLGREWSAVCVRAKECLSVQVIIERNLALLLEL